MFGTWWRRVGNRHPRPAGPCRGRACTLALVPLEGRAQPALLAPVSYGVSGSPLHSVAGDFNGDGHLDLAVSNGTYNSPGTGGVLLGRGDGTFHAFRPGYWGRDGWLATGDFDRDGRLDLAEANGNLLLVYRGNGDGTFGAGQSLNAGTWPNRVAAADFNGDGLLDLAATHAGPQPFYPGQVDVLLGRGDGTFEAGVTSPTNGRAYSLAVGDFDHDGRADLAVGNHGDTVTVLVSAGGGTFQSMASYTVGVNALAVQAVAVGDVNGDKRPDLVSTQYEQGDNTMAVLLGRGDGTFGNVRNTSLGFWAASAAVADFNLDGRLDVALTNGLHSGVSVLMGRGDGTFAAPRTYVTGGSVSFSLVAGDFNGDGWPDMIAANSDLGTVSVLLNGGKSGGRF